MKYRVLLDDPSIPLLERLLIVRQITCDVEDFFDPTFAHYRKDPLLLSDMDIAIDRIITAMKNDEKIMIFGDYDVDGITSSWALYTFISQDIGYKNISIMFPHRRHDGYGLKTKHIDTMKEKDIDLIITVDNGITSIAEAAYAREVGIDLIVTDHHHAGEIIPDCVAVINPQTSPHYSFKGLCGAGVAFKLINALMTKTTRSDEKRRQLFGFYLPIIAIATVADVVPLQDENRMIVKK
jgi:single-stranded-DNA-specific exonuclease